MITRRTILLFCLASLLFSVPFAFYAGEISEARLDHPHFDPLQMMDFGMRDWMRYCFGGFLVILVATPASLVWDLRKAWLARRRREHPILS